MSQYFARNLRRLRLDYGLTQEQLARLAGFDRCYVSSLERGLRPTDPSHVQVFATALGVPASRLLRRSRPARLPAEALALLASCATAEASALAEAASV